MIQLFNDKCTSTVNVSAVYLFLTAAFTIFFWMDGFAGYTFGFEYGNVAEALASNKGFADVFGKDSGPTAWCPPFYVLVQFFVFKLFGIKTLASFWAILLLRVLLMTIAFWLLLTIHYGDTFNAYKILLLPIFLAFSIFIIKKEFDDKTLTVFLSVLTVFLLSKIAEQQAHRYRYLMIILAIILPISNISLFGGSFILLCLIVIYNVAKEPSIISTRLAAALLGIMVISVAAWGVRNKLTMGKFIPFKSNLWFEVYLSNVEDYDGIIRQSNWLLYHPMSNDKARELYQQEGEIAFLEHYRTLSIEYLLSQPTDFARKVLNRAMNVFYFVSASNDVELVATNSIESSDLKALEEHHLILNNNWMCLDRPVDTFEALIASIQLKNPASVLADWNLKKEAMENRLFKSPLARISGLLLSLIPTIALLIGLFSRQIRKTMVFWISLYFFLFSVAPYILFSHYFRYQNFQFGFFTIFIFLSTAFLISHFFKNSTFTFIRAPASTKK